MACASRSTTRIGGSSISSSRSCASSLSPNALTPVCSFLKLPAVPTLLLLPDLDARPRDGAQRRQDSLSCPIGRQPCCRPIGRSQSRPTSSSTSIFDAFDASRAADADQAADRPRRRPWWATAAVFTRPPLRPSQELQRAYARMRARFVYRVCVRLLPVARSSPRTDRTGGSCASLSRVTLVLP